MGNFKSGIEGYKDMFFSTNSMFTGGASATFKGMLMFK